MYLSVYTVYTGLPKGSLVKLQLIQNAAARVLMKLKKREHTTPVLMELHWLPVHQRIDYKILTLVYKALHNLTPSYISDCLSRYIPNRMLRSSSAGLLAYYTVKLKRSGGTSFSHYAPKIWNCLPNEVRESTSIHIFKKRVKTFIFTVAYDHNSV